MTLEECLYYAVREDFNCRDGKRFLEPDERILPAVDMLAALPSPKGLRPVQIDSFCRCMQRRGRLDDLRKIPWLRIEVVREPRLF